MKEVENGVEAKETPVATKVFKVVFVLGMWFAHCLVCRSGGLRGPEAHWMCAHILPNSDMLSFELFRMCRKRFLCGFVCQGYVRDLGRMLSDDGWD